MASQFIERLDYWQRWETRTLMGKASPCSCALHLYVSIAAWKECMLIDMLVHKGCFLCTCGVFACTCFRM